MTKEITTITESAGQPRKVGKRWYVTIARPGKGATGTYSEEVLKNTGPVAFPAGTKSYFGHAPTEKRDARDQVGVFKQGAFWNEELGELGGYLTPFPRYKAVLDDMVDEDTGDSYVEASIHAAANKDSKGIVRELLPRRDNTVDLVAFAGLEGSGLKYQVESLFAAAAAEVEDNEEENDMTFEITKEQWETFTSTVSALDAKFDTFVTESKAEVQGVADQAAVDAAVDARVAEALAGIAEVEATIDAADIPTAVKESLKERARKGEDIADNLAGAVEIVAEAKKEAKPAPTTRNRGTVVVVDESANGESKPNFRVGRWTGAKN